MCFVINDDTPNAIIAQKDKVCYKVMVMELDEIISPFQNFKYKLNEVYKLKFPLKPELYQSGTVINEGFHSYTKLDAAKRVARNYHVIVKCVIPKDTEYYVDDFYNEYVSAAIIIKEVIIKE